MTKIMLVEDDKSLREIYGIRLIAEGYEIKSAGDGEEALAMAIKERPDLIISDVMMPKISGFDMLDILRATPETKDIKIIMMTALSSEDQRARGEALGANRYLVKSQVGIEDVVRTVHDVLADSPIAVASASQMFKTPTAPVAPIVSTPQPINITVQQNPAPAAPQPVAEPVPAPVTAMPQPTAPFASPAPTSLGSQIVNPAPAAPTQPTPITVQFAEPQPVVATPIAIPITPIAPTPTPIIATEPAPTNTYAPEPVVATQTAPEQPVATPAPTQTPTDFATLMSQELNNANQNPQQ